MSDEVGPVVFLSGCPPMADEAKITLSREARAISNRSRKLRASFPGGYAILGVMRDVAGEPAKGICILGYTSNGVASVNLGLPDAGCLRDFLCEHLGPPTPKDVPMSDFKDYLWAYGVISRRGPRDNRTDCEADTILIHVPSGEMARFRGTWYDDNYGARMRQWACVFGPSNDAALTGNAVRAAYEAITAYAREFSP